MTEPIADTGDNVTSLGGNRPLYDGCQQLALPSFAHADLPMPWTARRMRRGTCLHRAGMPASAVYVVRFGCLKSSIPGDSGEELVLDFPMRGDLIGADALEDIVLGNLSAGRKRAAHGRNFLNLSAKGDLRIEQRVARCAIFAALTGIAQTLHLRPPLSPIPPAA